jgi:predicted MFS family arabinose efflux permease
MSSSSAPSYRALLAVPGFPRLVGSMLLSRTAGQMSILLLVLFALDRFHSPQLSGITVLVGIVPGLLVSPLAGAVLDRGARVPLIVLDYCVGATSLALIALLGVGGLIAPWSLVLIAGLGSVTMPLSNSGTRSLFPAIVPRAMWDRANAVDSGGYVAAVVVGPGLAGTLVALVGTTWALLVPAALSLAAAAMVLGMSVPAPARMSSETILRSARAGLAYVLRNPGLRALAVTIAVFNLANGGLTVALPVLVLTRLHDTSVQVGLLFAVMGVAGIASGLVAGRFDSEGRERPMLSGGALVTAVALVALALAHSLVVAAFAMALIGLTNGPMDVALFSMRQRVTHPAWFGRAFAVSMSLNYIGFPIGSALTGPVVARSVSGAFVMATGFVLLAALASLLMLPSQRRRRVAAGTASRPSHPR